MGKSFEFLKTSLGLSEQDRVDELVLNSPFNYNEQLLLAIPNDVPEPNAKRRPDHAKRNYASCIVSIIKQAVQASRGNALILFTSYSLLNSVYEDVHEELESNGIMILKQGLLTRRRLLDKLRVEHGSVLFATDSFWEGVDVPGDSLRLVVITRLPFRVPTDPVIEARIEDMEAQGINSFLNYSVPVAVLKFKQGFGRLIRTKTDRGAVLVLDRRIISKFYGKYFLESLPECRSIIGKSDNIIKQLRGFY